MIAIVVIIPICILLFGISMKLDRIANILEKKE